MDEETCIRFCREDDIEWSRMELTFRQFMERYESKLPQVVRIAEGYCGKDSLHQLADGECYWIQGIKTQRRVFLTDVKKRSISVPLSYPAPFEMLSHGRSSTRTDHVVTIADALTQHRGSGDVLVLKMQDKVEFYKDASSVHVDQIGPMRFREEYDQKYLVAHSVSNGNLSIEPRIIPLYLPILLNVSVSLHGKNCTETEEIYRIIYNALDESRETTLLLENGLLLFSKFLEGIDTYLKPDRRSKNCLDSCTGINPSRAFTLPAHISSRISLARKLSITSLLQQPDGSDSERESYEDVDDENLVIRREMAARVFVLGRAVERGAVLMESHEKPVWSDRVMSLEDFYQEYQYSLPVMIKIHDGYYSSVSAHQCDRGEIFWVQGADTQTRVVMIDSNGLLVSIPKYFTALFHVSLHDGILTEAMPFHQALNECHCAGDKVFISPGNTAENLPCCYARLANVLGNMQFIEEYEQRYLLMNPINNNRVDSEQEAMPLYLPITIQPAEGLAGKAEAYTKLFYSNIHYILMKCRDSRASFDSGVQILPESQDRDTDLLEPVRSLMCLPSVSSYYSQQEEVQDSLTCSYENLCDVSCDTSMCDSFGEDIRRYSSADSVFLTSRRPSSSSDLYSEDHCMNSKNSEKDSDCSKPTSPQADPPDQGHPGEAELKDSGNNVVRRLHTRPSRIKRPLSYAFAVAEQPLAQHVDINAAIITAASPVIEANADSMSAHRGNVAARPMSKMAVWAQTRGIPTNLNSLNVKQVRRCLCFIGLGAKASRFLELAIDGADLVKLNDHFVRKGLGLSRFEAHKLSMFIHHNWRPRVQRTRKITVC